jgi:hypothetical protein
LEKFSAAHREVFEICGEYLAWSDRELRTVGTGSPRIVAMLKGRSSAGEYHRFHLLRWAEIEARSLTSDAKNLTKGPERVEAAENALAVVESALEFYPVEPSLIESRDLLLDLVASTRVTDLVEQAELAASGGEYRQAKSLYRDALFCLGRDNIRSERRERAALMINAEIEKIRLLEDQRS